MKITNQQKDFELPEAEVYPGALVAIYDLGIQETPWGDKDQLHMVFEIDYLKADGKKYLVGNTYTKSLYQKSATEKAPFRRVAEALLRREVTEDEIENGFDPFTLLGKSCQIDLIHKESKGKTYANIGGASKLVKGSQPYKPTTELTRFDFEVDGKNIPVTTPKHITQWIQRSKTWLGTVEDEQAGDDEKVTPNFAPDEDKESIPF